MQSDGNLVLYNAVTSAWASHTAKKNDILSQLTSQQVRLIAFIR
jgi:hypothetical protein